MQHLQHFNWENDFRVTFLSICQCKLLLYKWGLLWIVHILISFYEFEWIGYTHNTSITTSSVEIIHSYWILSFFWSLEIMCFSMRAGEHQWSLTAGELLLLKAAQLQSMKTSRIHAYGFIPHTHRLRSDPRQQPAQLTITEQIVCAHVPENTHHIHSYHPDTTAGEQHLNNHSTLEIMLDVIQFACIQIFWKNNFFSRRFQLWLGTNCVEWPIYALSAWVTCSYVLNTSATLYVCMCACVNQFICVTS